MLTSKTIYVRLSGTGVLMAVSKYFQIWETDSCVATMLLISFFVSIRSMVGGTPELSNVQGADDTLVFHGASLEGDGHVMKGRHVPLLRYDSLS